MRIFFFPMLLLSFAISANAGSAKDWKINKELKFQIVYLPAPTTDTASVSNSVPILNNIPGYQPDITNIRYSAIANDMGFPLPMRENADSLKLYLKLIKWPENLNAKISSRKIIDPFLLSQIPGGQEIDEYVSGDGNVLVKYALIDKTSREFSSVHPMRLSLPNSQSEFDSRLPFSSIYIQPVKLISSSSEIEQANQSADGVLSIHKAILALYTKVFYKLGENEKTLFFADVKRCSLNPEKICSVRVYSISKEPFVFKNYLTLPMPQDSNNVFLSGLLLIKLTDYVAFKPVDEKNFLQMKPDQNDFSTTFSQVWAHVLEFGSVFDRRAKK